MAYSHSYGTATDTRDFLGKLRDWMVSTGWTLEDDFVSANTPLLALTTTGESGDKYYGVYFMASFNGGYGGIMSGNNGSDNVYVYTCTKWDKIGTDYYSPSPGNYSNSGSGDILAVQSGAPSFLNFNNGSSFAANDTVFTFNSRYNGRMDRCTPNVRKKITTITSTQINFSTFAQDSNCAWKMNNRVWGNPAMVASTDGTETSLCITKRGPHLSAGGYMSDNLHYRENIWTRASSFSYFFYGDKDSIAVITRIPGQNYCGTYIGYFDSFNDTRTTLTTSNKTIGDTTIDVQNPDLFYIGNKYQINSGVYWNTIVIAGKSGNTLTSSVPLQNPCASNSIIGDDPLPVCTARMGCSYGFGSGSLRYSWNGYNPNEYGSYLDSAGTTGTQAASDFYFADARLLYNRKQMNDRLNVFPAYLVMTWFSQNTDTAREFVGTLRSWYCSFPNGHNNLNFAWSNEDVISIQGVNYKIFLLYNYPWSGSYRFCLLKE